MRNKILPDDFLLETKASKELYFNYAVNMPIFDYHNHLSPKDIAQDKQYSGITEAWLSADHYKWRAMRANGTKEELVTGQANDFERFRAWVEVLPFAAGNPLYHWSYLELSRYFGIDDLVICVENARKIYDALNEAVRSGEFTPRKLLLKMNVKALCTSDDPADTLEYHRKLKEDNFPVKVLPGFRPDGGMGIEDTFMFNEWLDRLETASSREIKDYRSFLEAVRIRQTAFIEAGCVTSDHGMEKVFAEDYTESEIEIIFGKARKSGSLKKDHGISDAEIRKYKSAVIYDFARMDCEMGLAMQLHIGAKRNNNSRMSAKLGPNSGCDSISDSLFIDPLAKLLDRLESEGKLPKTILYNLNPAQNETLAALAGCFQGGFPGKIQYGPAWWFMDHKSGIERHIETLSSQGLLGRFIGMLTDSRSFLSFSRHEYFRRVLCNILGKNIENNLFFDGIEHFGEMVRDICWNNAVNYFNTSVS